MPRKEDKKTISVNGPLMIHLKKMKTILSDRIETGFNIEKTEHGIYKLEGSYSSCFNDYEKSAIELAFIKQEDSKSDLYNDRVTTKSSVTAIQALYKKDPSLGKEYEEELKREEESKMNKKNSRKRELKDDDEDDTPIKPSIKMSRTSNSHKKQKKKNK